MQASMLLPRYDLFEYYKNAGKKTREQYVRKRIRSGEDVAEKDKIEAMQHLTPEVHLNTLQERYAAPTKVKPPVDDVEIWAQCETMFEMRGYVDIYSVAKETGELVDDVVRILKMRLFSESRIKGQYVR